MWALGILQEEVEKEEQLTFLEMERFSPIFRMPLFVSLFIPLKE
jgi:hypothetical protein